MRPPRAASQVFVDIYAATMLFFVYTIHAAIGYLHHGLFKLLGRLVFCAAVLTEAVFIHAIWHAQAVFDAAFEQASLSPSTNLLDPAWNDPFFALVESTVLESTVVRALAGLVLATLVAPDAFASEQRVRGLAERLGAQRDGLADRLVRRLYVLCFTLLCCLIGFTVLHFYVPDAITAEEAGYLVGGHCSGAEGFRAAAEVCASPTVSSPVHGQIACAHLQGCIATTLAQATEDELEQFYTVYVTVVIFYALTLVEGLGFFRPEEGARRAAWHRRARVLVACGIFAEVVFMYTLYGMTHAALLQADIDLDNNRPLAPAMAAAVPSITAVRLLVICLYVLAFVSADWDAQPASAAGGARDAPGGAPGGALPALADSAKPPGGCSKAGQSSAAEPHAGTAAAHRDRGRGGAMHPPMTEHQV